MMTKHRVNIGNSQNLKKIEDESVNLIVTSPPYPMIEMWDKIFSSLNPAIEEALNDQNGFEAYDLMNKELNKVWAEVDRVLVPGGIACINIGDATRKIGDSFQLYSNHSRIICCFEKMGYQVLPDILWRKQSNKPNKFMGSGMLPPNAYVTLEHEYILIFRKGSNREFKKQEEKEHRRGSAYFWEERNKWFSDVWEDVKGTSQKMQNKEELKNIKNKLRDINFHSPKNLSLKSLNLIDKYDNPAENINSLNLLSIMETELSKKANLDQLNFALETQSKLNEAFSSASRISRFCWDSEGVLKEDKYIKWSIQNINTALDVFKWENNSESINILQNGVYKIVIGLIGLENNKNFGIIFNDDENIIVDSRDNLNNNFRMSDTGNEIDITSDKNNVKFMEKYIACVENTKLKAIIFNNNDSNDNSEEAFLEIVKII